MGHRRYQLRLGLSRSACRRVVWGGALIVVLGVLAVACNRGGTTATLGERVGRYWELKQAHRWAEVYDGFLDPELRDEVSRDDFLDKHKLAFDILSYTIGKVREDGENGIVSVTNEANIPVPAGQGKMRMVRRTVMTEDKWVRRDGVWYIELPR